MNEAGEVTVLEATVFKALFTGVTSYLPSIHTGDFPFNLKGVGDSPRVVICSCGRPSLVLDITKEEAFADRRLTVFCWAIEGTPVYLHDVACDSFGPYER